MTTLSLFRPLTYRPICWLNVNKYFHQKFHPKSTHRVLHFSNIRRTINRCDLDEIWCDAITYTKKVEYWTLSSESDQLRRRRDTNVSRVHNMQVLVHFPIVYDHKVQLFLPLHEIASSIAREFEV